MHGCDRVRLSSLAADLEPGEALGESGEALMESRRAPMKSGGAPIESGVAPGLLYTSIPHPTWFFISLCP